MPRTAPHPDVVAERLAQSWAALAEPLDAAWARRDGGAIATVTGVPLPTLNGVWAVSPEPDADAVGRLLDAVAASGLPLCLQTRPEPSPAVRAAAEARDLARADDTPLMVLADAAELAAPPPAPGLAFRRLPVDEAGRHVALAADAFAAPAELFGMLMNERTFRVAGMAAYVGSVDGEDVVTGLGLVIDDAVGVFSIATPEAHRRRGYGGAMTAHVVAEAAAAGARWAWLQSSELGLGVYAALGFTTTERWPLWMTS